MRLPRTTLTAAVTLALAGCAVAPAPTPAGTATASPTGSPPGGPILLIGWEVREDRPDLLVVGPGGVVERRPLPAVPNGALASNPAGRLAFLSGPAAEAVLWLSEGPPEAPAWTSSRPRAPAQLQEPPTWSCLSPAEPARVAVQLVTDRYVVALVESDGLTVLPSGRLDLRPGRCAWGDTEHLLVAVDRPGHVQEHAFGVIAADGSGAGRVLAGPGGDDPVTSATLLAYVAHEGGRDYRVAIGPSPAIEGPVPEARWVLRSVGDRTFGLPALSADGKRLAVLESDESGRAARLLLYDLGEEGASQVVSVDISGAAAAGPAWVADAAAS